MQLDDGDGRSAELSPRVPPALETTACVMLKLNETSEHSHAVAYSGTDKSDTFFIELERIKAGLNTVTQAAIPTADCLMRDLPVNGDQAITDTDMMDVYVSDGINIDDIENSLAEYSRDDDEQNNTGATTTLHRRDTIQASLPSRPYIVSACRFFPLPKHLSLQDPTSSRIATSSYFPSSADAAATIRVNEVHVMREMARLDNEFHAAYQAGSNMPIWDQQTTPAVPTPSDVVLELCANNAALREQLECQNEAMDRMSEIYLAFGELTNAWVNAVARDAAIHFAGPVDARQ
ncbi:hypothetical protein FN846DRAFT_889978 [Sphaerosporella brunnea]|uniref:Uncharacterized protein n=1 Tax=Sphaerosporella brunnea TaxID=1250544 RepID=A0A5J5EXH6_9PEZI|nr:hypothetical protein FN846DRAFT_889978 [Sphaerosporella brunnea]